MIINANSAFLYVSLEALYEISLKHVARKQPAFLQIFFKFLTPKCCKLTCVILRAVSLRVCLSSSSSSWRPRVNSSTSVRLVWRPLEGMCWRRREMRKRWLINKKNGSSDERGSRDGKKMEGERSMQQFCALMPFNHTSAVAHHCLSIHWPTSAPLMSSFTLLWAHILRSITSTQSIPCCDKSCSDLLLNDTVKVTDARAKCPTTLYWRNIWASVPT